MSYNFKSKKIIISAGATGIGWATAKECLEKGAKVFLCDIDLKSINKLKKHPLNNKRLFSFHCDASNENDVINFFKEIKKKTQKIDALINNVGVAGPTGGSKTKPVGTVCISIGNNDEILSKQHFFEGDRNQVRAQSAETAIKDTINFLKNID